jgi:hypothetical protein
MLEGLDTAATGKAAQQQRLDAVGNDLNKELTRPSDDPFNTSRALALRESLDGIKRTTWMTPRSGRESPSSRTSVATSARRLWSRTAAATR